MKVVYTASLMKNIVMYLVHNCLMQSELKLKQIATCAFASFHAQNHAAMTVFSQVGLLIVLFCGHQFRNK